MPSRADVRVTAAPVAITSAMQVVRAAGSVLHGVGLLCMVLLAWRLFLPADSRAVGARVAADGSLDLAVVELLRARRDTIDVTLDGLPTAVARAELRAVRGSGHALRVTSPRRPAAIAVAAEQEWTASGGTRVQVVAGDPGRQVVSDAAGLIDSIAIDSTGLRTRSGPVEGALRMGAAAAPPLTFTAPAAARVLVVGAATWESRFVIAALEEAGWPVDAAVSLSPKVTVTQGAARLPTRGRHAIVVVLPGAPDVAVSALPAFVRGGGGLVIVGEAARLTGMSALRAGSPGATVGGEAGAEASEEPRRGLDLVPMTMLAEGSVELESRDGRIAVAARRLGAGRVLQVGYDNSWLWRMGGTDEAPAAHRRWWSTSLSGLVPIRAPVSRIAYTPEDDTLDAAPLAALVRDIGMPRIGAPSSVMTPASSFVTSLRPGWLLALALLSLVASWTLRRWRGLA